MKGIHLTAAQQQQLAQTLHDTHDARLYRRTLAILECSWGRQVKEVAQALGVTRQSIHNWVVRLQQEGNPHALVDGPRPGRPRQADARVETLPTGIDDGFPAALRLSGDILDRAVVAGSSAQQSAD